MRREWCNKKEIWKSYFFHLSNRSVRHVLTAITKTAATFAIFTIVSNSYLCWFASSLKNIKIYLEMVIAPACKYNWRNDYWNVGIVSATIKIILVVLFFIMKEWRKCRTSRFTYVYNCCYYSSCYHCHLFVPCEPNSHTNGLWQVHLHMFESILVYVFAIILNQKGNELLQTRYVVSAMDLEIYLYSYLIFFICPLLTIFFFTF